MALLIHHSYQGLQPHSRQLDHFLIFTIAVVLLLLARAVLHPGAWRLIWGLRSCCIGSATVSKLGFKFRTLKLELDNWRSIIINPNRPDVWYPLPSRSGSWDARLGAMVVGNMPCLAGHINWHLSLSDVWAQQHQLRTEACCVVLSSVLLRFVRAFKVYVFLILSIFWFGAWSRGVKLYQIICFDFFRSTSFLGDFKRQSRNMRKMSNSKLCLQC